MQIIFNNPNVFGHIDVFGDTLSGWIASDQKIESIDLESDGKVLISCKYGARRSDVRDAFPQLNNALYSGFSVENPFPWFKTANFLIHTENEIIRSNAFSCEKNLDGFLHADVPLSKSIAHNQWPNLLNLFDKKEYNVLEVGSRVVTGANFRSWFKQANYTGFDIHDGPNVDVVGDSHKLSSYFKDMKFDLIFSSAVFEHLAMPWLVATEIAKLLNIGGHVLIETHYSFSSHERPWHFFQFSDEALKVLFNPVMGFECIEAGVSNPIVGYYSPVACDYLRGLPVTGLYAHSEFYAKKVFDNLNFKWDAEQLSKIVQFSHYPAPAEEREREREQAICRPFYE